MRHYESLLPLFIRAEPSRYIAEDPIVVPAVSQLIVRDEKELELADSSIDRNVKQ
jgi:hypothetical protein